ncbi:MAG: hypothetical protein R3280_11345 [Marinobacter sp.]|uniref:hypothetical protein n=1 Tax=Marinobacter sp. TaxID=50741 RepID=UPI00299E38AA|nr:hypothetical protein [Marinobacter sp.]MDX1635227.1 hypothetical protein [Marinobacter sp.]
MNKTLNGHYENPDQARNTQEDLVATGIPQDKVFVDEENQTIKVMIPAEEEREIQEIFDRHDIRY